MSQKKQNHTEELQITYHREYFLSIKDPILNLRMGEKLYTGFYIFLILYRGWNF